MPASGPSQQISHIAMRSAFRGAADQICSSQVLRLVIRTSGDPRIISERMRVVDVDFVDHAMGDGSNIR
jgi:hypothetical protein